MNYLKNFKYTFIIKCNFKKSNQGKFGHYKKNCKKPKAILTTLNINTIKGSGFSVIHKLNKTLLG